MYKLYMCLKYLVWRWRLSLLSVLPVALGVFLIIFAGGIMTGFADRVEDMTRGVLADIVCVTGLSGIPHYEEFCQEVSKDPQVELATPIVYAFGLVKITDIRDFTKPCEIIGIRPEEKAVMGRFGEYLERQKNVKRPSLAIPEDMAAEMRILGRPPHPGVIAGSQVIREGSGKETFQLTGPGGTLVLTTVPIRPSGALELAPGSMPKVNTAAFTIVDTFKSGFWPSDSSYVYIGLEEAQKLVGMDNPRRANQIEIRVAKGADPEKARQTVQKIWQEFQKKYPDISHRFMAVDTWETRQSKYLEAVKVQRNITILMLSAILLAAGVLILVTTWVICHIKTRDIGILKALGASDGGIGAIFMTYGLTIGLIGAALGLAIAFLGLAYLNTLHEWVSRTIGFEVFSAEVYYFDEIPHKEPAWLVWGTFWATVLLGTLSSAIASLGTARRPPVEALRYE